VETILVENIKDEDHSSAIKDLFENSKDGLVLLDNDYKIISISENFTEEFGYASKELIGLSFEHIFKPEFEEKTTLIKSIITPPHDLLTCKIETKLGKKISCNITISKLIKSPNSYSALIMIKKSK
jgi:PAS domain S-box-containing protein